MMNKKFFLSVIASCAAIIFSGTCASISAQRDGWIYRGLPLTADDTITVNADGYLENRKGEAVVLRGINLGGWLIQESWMCPVYGIDREWALLDTIREMEKRGWSAAEIQELFDTYQDNWLTEDDFNFLKSLKINYVRLPFWYRNFMSDDKGSWIHNDDGSGAETTNPGFKRFDWAIEQAKSRGMYVIPALHGAVGGQAMSHGTGTLRKNELYTNPAYEQYTANLWKAIAKRYKDEPAIAAFDLLGEPNNNDGYEGANNWPSGSPRAVHETIRLYDRLYREVRSVSPDRILMFEAVWDMGALPDPAYVHNGPLDQTDHYSGKTVVWENVLYSMHLYDHSKRNIDKGVNELKNARSVWKVAVIVGEFKNDVEGLQGYAYKLYNTNKYSWSSWTYKIAGSNMGSWSLYQSIFKPNVNPMTDSYETIKQKWGETLRTFRPGSAFAINGYAKTDMFDKFGKADD